MNQTRYCSTCGSLLSEGAAICGECGARYQPSPYERRATDAPGAWSQAPGSRSRDLGAPQEQTGQDEGIELITRESLDPETPGATALRSQEQYDQMMVTQPPTNQPGNGSAPSMAGGPGSPSPAPVATAPVPMEPPLDGCTPASPLKRLLAALVDAVIASLMVLPMLIGVILIATSEEIGLLPRILVGVGAALPAAYHLVMIWLVGAKGFTLGKLILGLRVTRESQGGPIGFLRALGRYVLYGLIPLIMALSIFLDPKKHLRGLHDRAVDSVVVDGKEGRDPMSPRPDDFERAGAEHYLGAPSVAVSTHENLLSEPGAAWTGGGSPAAQPADSSRWVGSSQSVPSPYAPPAPNGPPASATEASGLGGAWSAAPAPQEDVSSQQGTAGGWAPPTTDPVVSPPQHESWAPPAVQQASDRPAAPPAPQPWEPSDAPQPVASQQPWDQAASPQPMPPQQSWERPRPEPAASDVSGGAAPAAPGAEPSAAQSAASGADAASGGTPGGWPGDVEQSPPGDSSSWAPDVPGQGPVSTPGELTADAWVAEDHGVDEQTRLTAVDEPMEDLEQTRLSAVTLPEVKKVRLTMDDGAERLIDKAVVIGRNPSAVEQEALFVLKDDTRSVSKTHLRLDGTGEDVTVTDLGSTNGSSILREDGSREALEPNSPTVLPTGARVTLGDRVLSVEREQ